MGIGGHWRAMTRSDDQTKRVASFGGARAKTLVFHMPRGICDARKVGIVAHNKALINTWKFSRTENIILLEAKTRGRDTAFLEF